MAARLTELCSGAEGLLGITLSAAQIEAFSWYAAELASWNERYNLTAITDPGQIAVKHFLDSITCVLAMGKKKGDVPLPENQSATPEHVVELRRGLRPGQVRETEF